MLGDPDRLRPGADGRPQGKLIGATEELYQEEADPSELAVLGLLPEDIPPRQFDLWPENWPAIQLFLQFQTQWRTGMNGPTGLDYNVIFHELDRRGLESDAYDDLMGSVRVIEDVALRILHKK